MPFQEKILTAKLSVPQHPEIFIPPRFSGLLARMAEKRLTLVVAGAGHGKTALAAHMVRQKNLKTVWYNLDFQDRDFFRFIRYIRAGFGPYIKSGQASMERRLSDACISVMPRIRILEILVPLLTPPDGEKMLLVLDDFHTVQASADIRESVKFLLKHLPAAFHIIILTRAEPRIGLSEWRLMGQVTEINESDLLFTFSETRSFYSEHFKLSLPPTLEKQLYQKSKGWIAGLVMFYLALKKKPRRRIKNQLLSGEFVFAYLEEEIFRFLSPEIQVFMLKTSPLDTLDPEFCDACFNTDHSKKVLDHLADNHLLTFKSEPGPGSPSFYTYHHLLKTFLLNRLREKWPREAVRQLYKKIARHLEADGHELPAVQYYIDGGLFPTAIQRLGKWEAVLFESGQICRVRHFLIGFPDRILRSSPRLLYIKAKLDSFSGESHKAISLFEAALKGFEKARATQHLLDCRIQLGLNYYYTGHIQEAELLLEACLGVEDSGKQLKISGLLILICSILGKIHKADAHAEAARQELAQEPGAVCLKMKNWIEFTHAYRFFVSGDFGTAYTMSLRTLDRYSKMNTGIIMPLAYLHAALPAYFLNEFDNGHAWAEKGLALIKKTGIRDNQSGWLNYAMALHLCGLDRLEHALSHGRKSLAFFEQQSNYWGQANTCDLIHFILLKQGDIDGAENALDQGRRVIGHTGLTYTRGILETGKLNLLLEKGRFKTVAAQLPQVREKVGISKFYTFKTLLISSRCSAGLNNRPAALKDLEQCLDMAEKNGYGHQLANSGGWIEPLLDTLYSNGARQRFIESIFQLRGKPHHLKSRAVRGATPDPKAFSGITPGFLPEPSPSLRISLLGRFRILKGKGEIRLESFRNTNALTMIKYLALNHRKGFVHRDELIELLWPEQNFNRTRKRFNVVVSAIRKFFNPDIKRGTPSMYLKKQGVAFRLCMGNKGEVDVTAFLDEIKKGKKAVDPDRAAHHYETAQTLYTGPFLAEDTYTQWCIEEREKLRHKYLSVLWKLICHFGDRSDYGKGIDYAEKYLDADSSVEPVYQWLMQFHAMAGNRSQVKKTYENCLKHVSQSLDCPPDPKTVDLYHSLLSLH